MALSFPRHASWEVAHLASEDRAFLAASRWHPCSFRSEVGYGLTLSSASAKLAAPPGRGQAWAAATVARAPAGGATGAPSPKASLLPKVAAHPKWNAGADPAARSQPSARSRCPCLGLFPCHDLVVGPRPTAKPSTWGRSAGGPSGAPTPTAPSSRPSHRPRHSPCSRPSPGSSGPASSALFAVASQPALGVQTSLAHLAEQERARPSSQPPQSCPRTSWSGGPRPPWRR
mmetsp:Transcript_22806/g.51802  ORF Transcript_22806/g.51802 Transcript_22806/m.51802 type:complete len:230 (+) Transcript_22806:277-966(+)